MMFPQKALKQSLDFSPEIKKGIVGISNDF